VKQIEGSSRGVSGKPITDTPFALASLQIQQIRFASRSEAAIAVLCEHYIPGWRCILGRTYQAPIANGCSADFYYPDADLFHEFHPINLQREFRNAESYEGLMRLLRNAKPNTQDEFNRLMKAEKAAEYRRYRTALVKAAHPQADVTFTETPADVLHRIVSPLGVDVPPLRVFVSEWNEIIMGLRAD